MSSYYSAVGEDDTAYLLARVFQLFGPGIPQVYYVGALFGVNDLEALEAMRDPRSANRHDYTLDEIAERVGKPQIQKFLEVLRFRNTFPAFGGAFTVIEEGAGVLRLTWSDASCSVALVADFPGLAFRITTRRGDAQEELVFSS